MLITALSLVKDHEHSIFGKAAHGAAWFHLQSPVSIPDRPESAKARYSLVRPRVGLRPPLSLGRW